MELKGKAAPVPVYALGGGDEPAAVDRAARRSVVLIVPAATINTVLDYRDALDLVAGFGFVLLGVGAAVTAACRARVPGNAVGWVLLALGAGVAVTIACGAYGEVSARRRTGRCPPTTGLRGSATGRRS